MDNERRVWQRKPGGRSEWLAALHAATHFHESVFKKKLEKTETRRSTQNSPVGLLLMRSLWTTLVDRKQLTQRQDFFLAGVVVSSDYYLPFLPLVFRSVKFLGFFFCGSIHPCCEGWKWFRSRFEDFFRCSCAELSYSKFLLILLILQNEENKGERISKLVIYLPTASIPKTNRAVQNICETTERKKGGTTNISRRWHIEWAYSRLVWKLYDEPSQRWSERSISAFETRTSRADGIVTTASSLWCQVFDGHPSLLVA